MWIDGVSNFQEGGVNGCMMIPIQLCSNTNISQTELCLIKQVLFLDMVRLSKTNPIARRGDAIKVAHPVAQLTLPDIQLFA